MTNCNIYGLRVEISTVYKFSKQEIGVAFIIFDFFYNIEYIWLGVGKLTVYNFSNQRGLVTLGNTPIFNLMCLIVQYKNIYGLTAVISTSTFSNWREWRWPRDNTLYFIWLILSSSVYHLLFSSHLKILKNEIL